jgi:hypothetical protein
MVANHTDLRFAPYRTYPQTPCELIASPCLLLPPSSLSATKHLPMKTTCCITPCFLTRLIEGTAYAGWHLQSADDRMLLPMSGPASWGASIFCSGQDRSASNCLLPVSIDEAFHGILRQTNKSSFKTRQNPSRTKVFLPSLIPALVIVFVPEGLKKFVFLRSPTFLWTMERRGVVFAFGFRPVTEIEAEVFNSLDNVLIVLICLGCRLEGLSHRPRFIKALE